MRVFCSHGDRFSVGTRTIAPEIVDGWSEAIDRSVLGVDPQEPAVCRLEDRHEQMARIVQPANRGESCLGGCAEVVKRVAAAVAGRGDECEAMREMLGGKVDERKGLAVRR